MTDDRPPPDTARDDDLVEQVASVLWPGRTVTRGRGGPRRVPSDRELVVLPRWDRPRLLLPARTDHAAAAVRAFAGGRDGVVRRTVERVLAAAAAGRLPTDRVLVEHTAATASAEPPTGLRDHVAEQLGARLAFAAVRLGSDRPNQKPVVALGDDHGRVRAFVKVAAGPLTTSLVAHEARTLAPDGPVAGLTHVRAPQLVTEGRWHGRHVVAMEALGAARRDHPTGAVTRTMLGAAMRDVAGDTHRSTMAAWVDEHARPRAAAVAGRLDDTLLAQLDRALERAAATLGPRPVSVGSWHGDLRPWNLAATGDGRRLELWDWERHAAGAVLGSDAVHHDFPVPPRDPEQLSSWAAQVEVAAARAMRLLAVVGLDRDDVTTVRAAHVVQLLLREAEDVAVQPDVRRPHQSAGLLWLLDDLLAGAA